MSPSKKKPRGGLGRRTGKILAAVTGRPRIGGRLFDRRHLSRPGTPPGTLQTPPRPPHDGAPEVVPTIRVIAYGPQALEEVEVTTAEQIAQLHRTHPVAWVDVVGLHDLALIQGLGELFGLHDLALEDVLNVGQRPKTEEYDGHHFIILRLVHPGPELSAEQLSLFFGKGFVVTFQERPGDFFEPVRDRLRRGRGRIRGSGPDYLAYALIDAIVDQFFPLLESFGERLEELEDELIADPTPGTLEQIYRARRELLLLRRTAWPAREVVAALERDDSEMITPQTKIFLRDCYDHTVESLDLIETYRELASGMLDVYLSSLSNRMNEVMKVLTIMATLFIPLTFVAGIYGMNFDPTTSPWNMPELGWRYGYPAALAVMALMAVGLIYYFRRKNWL